MTARRFIWRGTKLLAKLVLAVLILALMAIDVFFIALELPAGQRFVLGKVNAMLAEQFRGTLRIDSVDDIDLSGVRGAKLSLLDPEGTSIAVMQGVGGRVNLPALLGSLIGNEGPLKIHVDRVVVGDAALLLKTDPNGVLTIQSSFEPKHPDPVPPEPGREIDFVLARSR